MLIGPLQLSVAVTNAGLGTGTCSAHCTTMFEGQTIVGGTKSPTVKVWRQLLLFPQPSEAVQVRAIVNDWGQVPGVEISLKTTIGVGLQLSVAVAVPVLAGNMAPSQVVVKLGGQVMMGAVLSDTRMLWVQLLLFPQASVANQVRIIVNSCGQIPPVVASVKPIFGAVSQLSVAVGLPVPDGNVLALQSTEAFAGQDMVGAVPSITVMVCVQFMLFPLALVAVQVRVMVYDCGQFPPEIKSV